MCTQNEEKESSDQCNGKSEEEERKKLHRDDEDAMEVNDTTFMLSIQSLSIIANYIFSISLFPYNSKINVISQSVLYAIYASSLLCCSFTLLSMPDDAFIVCNGHQRRISSRTGAALLQHDAFFSVFFFCVRENCNSLLLCYFISIYLI